MRKNKKLIIICIMVAAILAAAGGVLIYNSATKADPGRMEASYEKLQQSVIDAKVDPYANTVDFEELWGINADVFAWITVPGTNVDYPVLTSEEKDNSYYLNTTIDHKAGLPGSIYMENYNSAEMTDPVTLIYGHNLEDYDTMFTQLHKYEDKEFFEEQPYFYIYLPDKTLKYQVFAAVGYDDKHILANYNLSLELHFEEFIDSLYASLNGFVNEDVEVEYGDNVVILSTCIADYADQRWLVCGKLVDEAEL